MTTTTEQPRLEIYDLYCGIGGWTCGAISYLKENNITDAYLYGVDENQEALGLWKKNVEAAGFECETHPVHIDRNFKFPDQRPNLIMLMSPPCTPHSKAKSLSGGPTPEEAKEGALQLRLCLDAIATKGYTRFALENVSVEGVTKIVDEFKASRPYQIAHHTLDAANFGVPSSRSRLVVSTPAVTHALKNAPVVQRSVAQAFADRGKTPRGKQIRNANRSTPNFRRIEGPSYTVVASHPLVWANNDESNGVLEPDESAILMSFPDWWDWKAETKVKTLLGVGNAVAPLFAQAVVKALMGADTGGQLVLTGGEGNVRNIPEEIMAEVQSLKRQLAEVIADVKRLKRRSGDGSGDE